MNAFDPSTHIPLNRRALIRLVKTPAVNPGGVILLAPTSVKDTQIGRVVAVAVDADQELKGHYVLVDRTAGIKIGESDRHSFVSYHEDHIQAIVDPDTPQEELDAAD